MVAFNLNFFLPFSFCNFLFLYMEEKDRIESTREISYIKCDLEIMLLVGAHLLKFPEIKTRLVFERKNRLFAFKWKSNKNLCCPSDSSGFTLSC